MRLTRIYYPFSAKKGEKIFISDEKAHYLRNVLRCKLKQQLRIFNPQQEEFLAQIVSINKKTVELMLLNNMPTIARSCLNITLAQAISKGERMDYSIQKATELGIATIQPLVSEFCEVKLKGVRLEKKIKHWQNIAISASEQCFRADVPHVLAPVSCQDYTKKSHTGMFLEPNETIKITQCAKQKWQKFVVAIGPEGGWSADEIHLLKNCGLQGVNMGQRILRTETMAPALLSAIHALWGDFV